MFLIQEKVVPLLDILIPYDVHIYVQAALCTIPGVLVEHHFDHDHEDYEKYKTWADQILITSVFAILVTAPIGVICIEVLGPLWLQKTEYKGKSGSHLISLNNDQHFT